MATGVLVLVRLMSSGPLRICVEISAGAKQVEVRPDTNINLDPILRSVPF